MNNIPVVYEDEWLLIVNKPSGLLTIPSPRGEARTLTSILNADLEQEKITYRLHPCHRLDRETSGLLIYAKGKSIQQKMMDEFKKRQVKKTYIAFVQGYLKPAVGSINNRIDGLSATTHYRALEKRKGFSVVEVKPQTGRTNQIRIHFKQIGHPIVGESKFAFRKDFPLRFKHLCLHAKALEFIHPVTKKSVFVETDLPEDLQLFKERTARK